MSPQEYQTQIQALMQEHNGAVMEIQKTFQEAQKAFGEAIQKENINFQTKIAALQAELNKPPTVPPAPPTPTPKSGKKKVKK